MLKTYRGSCHCGAVTFEADLDLSQSSYRCNCSICRRNCFWPAVAKPENFRLLTGEADLTQYLFNTRKNQHYFASIVACAASASVLKRQSAKCMGSISAASTTFRMTSFQKSPSHTLMAVTINGKVRLSSLPTFEAWHVSNIAARQGAPYFEVT